MRKATNQPTNQPTKNDYEVRLADLTPALQVSTATQDELKAIHKEIVEDKAQLGNIKQQNALSILKKEIHGNLQCIVNSGDTLPSPYQSYDITMFVSKNRKLLELFKTLDHERLKLFEARDQGILLNKADAAFYLLQKKPIMFEEWLIISKDLIAAAQRTPEDEKTIQPNLNDAVILKCVIDTADFLAAIWKNPLCSAYALYLLKIGQITFKQWRTVSMILIAKVQLTTEQPLQDKYAKTGRTDYGVTIKRLVEEGQFTSAGEAYLNGMYQQVEKLGCKINPEEIKDYILKLDPIEQCLVGSKFDKGKMRLGIVDPENIETFLLIQLVNLPFALLAPTHQDNATHVDYQYYWLPSPAIIGFIFEKINPKGARPLPILGNINERTLKLLHLRKLHAQTIYHPDVTTNPEAIIDDYLCGPWVAWLHDLVHALCMNLFSEEELDRVFEKYIPALQLIQAWLYPYRCQADLFDFCYRFLERIIERANDFDLTNIYDTFAYGKQTKTTIFEAYIRRCFTKDTVGADFNKNPGRLILYSQKDDECIFIEDTRFGKYRFSNYLLDPIYFALHKFAHDPQCREYHDLFQLILKCVDESGRYRNKKVMDALRTVAQHSAGHDDKLIVNPKKLKSCQVDWSAWLELITELTDAQLWVTVTQNPEQYKELLTMMSDGTLCFLPMTEKKRQEWREFCIERLLKEMPSDNVGAVLIQRMQSSNGGVTALILNERKLFDQLTSLDLVQVITSKTSVSQFQTILEKGTFDGFAIKDFIRRLNMISPVIIRLLVLGLLLKEDSLLKQLDQTTLDLLQQYVLPQYTSAASLFEQVKKRWLAYNLDMLSHLEKHLEKARLKKRQQIVDVSLLKEKANKKANTLLKKLKKDSMFIFFMGDAASRSAEQFFGETILQQQEIKQKLLQYIDTRGGMQEVADIFADVYFIRYFTQEDMLNIVHSTFSSSLYVNGAPRLIAERVAQFILQPPDTAAGAIYGQLFPKLPKVILRFAKHYPESNVTKSIIEKLHGTYTAEEITTVLNNLSLLAADFRNEETDEVQGTDLISVPANQQREEYSNIIDTIEQPNQSNQLFQLKTFLVDEIQRLPKTSWKSAQFIQVLSKLNELTECTEEIIEKNKQEVEHIAAKHQDFTYSFLKRLWSERRSPKSLENFYRVFPSQCLVSQRLQYSSDGVVVPEKSLSGRRLSTK